jgi:dolichol-phosphate mannosyltransferase
MPERHRFLRGLVSWIGFRRTFVEFEAPARAAGHSKYTLRRMVALAVNAVFSFSTVPIRVASRLGAALVVGGLGYLTYILARYFLVADAVPGWGSLICTVLVLGGMQLIFMGLIGEYLARVYEEAKHRPLYFFNEEPHGKPAGEWDEAVLAEHVAP